MTINDLKRDTGSELQKISEDIEVQAEAMSKVGNLKDALEAMRLSSSLKDQAWDMTVGCSDPKPQVSAPVQQPAQ